MQLADIVRYKRDVYGLYEVTGIINGQLYITNDQANTEHKVSEDELILVCRADSRLDIKIRYYSYRRKFIRYIGE